MDQQRLQAMQALMQQMGMAAGGGVAFNFGGAAVGGNTQSEIKSILAKVKNSTNEVEQLDGLNLFINMLNMATEQTIASINPQHFVGPIMSCFNKHHNPELMLVAARSLTYLVDANTHTVRVMQRDDHLSVLLDSLRSIMDVEFAEQVLTCVDKLSTDDPSMLLQRDGVSAIMGFLDFFSITTQRLILHTVARIADSFRPQYFDKIESSLPTIRNCLRHDDNKMREEALTALTRFVKKSSLDPNCVKQIFGDSGPAIMDILEKRPTNAMFGTAIQLISTATNASAAVCESLINIGAVSFLAGLVDFGNNNNNNNNNAVASGDGTPSSPFRASSLPNESSSNMGAHSPSSSILNASGLVSASSAAATAAQQRIPHERVIDICNCLVSFAPDITDPTHYINYIDTADRVEELAAMGAPKKSSVGSAKASKAKVSQHGREEDVRAFLKALARQMQGGAEGSGAEEDDNAHSDDVDIEGRDEDEDEDDDNDDYNDFNPHEMTPEEQKTHLAALVEDGRLTIDNKIDRNKACTNGRHSCDICSARISDSELWLRCNTRNDYDVCAACVLEMDGDEEHTYTHMKAVFPPRAVTINVAASPSAAAITAASAGTNTAAARAEEDQRSLRVAMIQKTPYLVNRLAEVLPVMCRLHLHNDDKAIRSHCLTFVCRVVHYATADCLRQVLLDCPMCELVTYLLTSPQLSTLGRCVHICEQLMIKLPDVYTDLFIREGVTNGLAIVKSSVSVDKRADIVKRPVAEAVRSVEGWRAVLAFTANEIVNKFEDSVDSGRIAVMESLCVRLRTEQNPTAAIQQAAEVLGDISTFELMNSDVIGSILAQFTSVAGGDEGPEEFVARFVSEMSSKTIEGDQHFSTLLERFVHQLQSSASQIEKFTPPNNGGDSARDPIRLTLRPHDPTVEEGQASKRTSKKGASKDSKKVSKDTATTAPTTTAAGRKKSGKRSNSSAGGNSNANDNDNANNASAENTSVPSLKKTEGRSATVSIDPLASVLGIVDFIRNNLLPNSKPKKDASTAAAGGTNNADEDDAVEDIDPTANSSPPSTPVSVQEMQSDDDPSAAKRARKENSNGATATPTADTAIYLRYRNHALPNQWTMLQVMQQIVNKNKKDKPSNKKESFFEGADIPTSLRQLMALDSSQIVEIHYSTEPFTSPTVTKTAYGSPAAGAAESQLQQQRPVRFNPNLLLTSGAISVRSALTRSYHGTAPFVTPVLADILKLLSVLYAACTEWGSLMTWLAMRDGSWALPKSLTEPRISHAEFVNPKINSKVIQHSANVAMTGQHDSAWYVRVLHDYPFLLTPATRKFLFEVTYFGVSRSLVRLQELAQESGTLADNERALAGRRQNRIVRRKCRVIREKPLECAMQVLASNKATLGSVFEFEFKGEPGSGLGPTMEFYALVGAALSEKSLHLWRKSEDDSETHFTPLLGLYPAPFMPASSGTPDFSCSPTAAVSSPSAGSSQPQHIVKHYTFLGRFLARVLLDRRIPNLRLSRPLLKMLRGDELAFDDLYGINPKIYEVLLSIVISDHSSDTSQRGVLTTLPKPCAVEDLGLNFTLPGMEEIPLIPDGENIDVTRANMSLYAQELSTAMLCASVNTAVKALRDGFTSVISAQALRCLTVDELSAMLKGHEERITLAELEANVACDHGYSASSPTIRIFLEILSEMSQPEQQKFFQFLTGSPMLPVGGLAALKPKFTIVRKTSSDPLVPEQVQLPSAMTCQNFLKLPAYETKALMSEKLKMAVDEGANAFLFT